jgi:hypothetical protein
MSFPSSGDVSGRRLDRAGAKAGKRGVSVGSPWAYGRPNEAGHTRRSSNKQAVGPARPSADRAKPLYAGNKDRSGI